MTEQPRFCQYCGAPLSAPASAVHLHQPNRTVKLFGGAALIALVAFVAGDLAGRGPASANGAAEQNAAMSLSAVTPAPDISQLSPEERASRLFNRVMLYSEQKKMDSARFFAPMAIQSYEMIGPLDLHARYDVGIISAAVGDVTRARTEEDAILAAKPRNLLGLVLAMRVATLSKDSAALTKFAQRLKDAAPVERATGLKEYVEHARDIDDALAQAATVLR